MMRYTQNRLLLAAALFVTACAAIALLEHAGAAATQNVGTDGDACRDLAVALVLNQNAAGDVVFCIHYAPTVATSTSSWQLSASLETPPLTGTSPSLILTATAAGCSAGSATTFGTTANAAAGAQTSSTWAITMTGNQCRGYVEGKVTSAGVTLFDSSLSFNAQSQDATRNVANTGILTVHQDPLSGAVTVTNAGGQTLTVHQDPISGSLAVHQDPLSGSIKVNGTLTLHQDPLSGAITVTNAGGQTLAVHQDPITGSLNVHQDPICTATQHCHVDSNTSTTIVGNSTQVMRFPDNLTVNAHSPGSETMAMSTSWDNWLPIIAAVLAWLACAIGTRFIRKVPLRIACDLVAYSVLLLPLGKTPFLVLAAAETALLIYDLIALVTDDKP